MNNSLFMKRDIYYSNKFYFLFLKYYEIITLQELLKNTEIINTIGDDINTNIYSWLFINENTIILLQYFKLTNIWIKDQKGSYRNNQSISIYAIFDNVYEKKIQDYINQNDFSNNSVFIQSLTASIPCLSKNIKHYMSEFNKLIDNTDYYPSKVLLQNILNNNCYNPINSMFDKTYVINLEKRPDRLLQVVNRLNKLNIINYCRFDAINGYRPEYNHIWKQLFIKSSYRFNSPGALGYLLSMRNIFVDAINNKYKNILILDDDVIFKKDFINSLKLYNQVLPKWYLLYLGCSQLKHWDKIKIHNIDKLNIYYPQGTSDGSFAIGVNYKIFNELIDLIDKTILPFDSGPLREIQRKYSDKCIVLYPNLIIADVTNSDIRSEKGPEYMIKFANLCKWKLNDYDIV